MATFHYKDLRLTQINETIMPSKKECPGCALEIDRNREVCPVCGYEFPQTGRSFRLVVWLMLAIFLYPLFLLARKIVAMF